MLRTFGHPFATCWVLLAQIIIFDSTTPNAARSPNARNICCTQRWRDRLGGTLPPFSLIRDFEKQNTWGNVSKISVSLACYLQMGSKSTNCSHWCDLPTFSTSWYRAVIGGFRSDLSITSKTDGNFGNVSAGVLFSKVAYQRKRW